MKQLLILFIFFSFFSCQETFSEIKNITEIEGDWESEFETISIDTDKMTITVNDSLYWVLTSRHYDKPSITVSSGSVMFYDAPRGPNGPTWDDTVWYLQSTQGA